MTMAAKRASCSTCGKEDGRVTCVGCSKLFCYNDFDAHRQNLRTQLDETEVDRDVFRQTLTDKIADPQSQALIQQINEWENESINKIRQTAEEARQILMEHTAKLNTKLEGELDKLTARLRESREKNEFFEPDLDEWREELKRMNDELARPPSVQIRNDLTPLITKLIVAILDVGQDQKSDETRRVAMMTNNAERSVTCSFCNAVLSSSEIGEHLLACGNKTLPCPACGKFVRRAIFRYHYDNGCADLNEFSGDVSTAAKQSDDSLLSSLRLAAGVNRRTKQTGDFESRSRIQRTTPHQSILDRLSHDDQSSNTAGIPCEVCEKLIEWCHFEEHLKTCIERQQDQVQNQPRPNKEINEISYARCKHCNEERFATTLRFHEATCAKHPRRIAFEAKRSQISGQPPQ